MKDIEKLINIGVPCYSEITLPIQNLTLFCARSVSYAIDVERGVNEETKKRVNQITDFASSNSHYHLFKNLNLYADAHSISRINWSENQRMEDLFYGLTTFGKEDSYEKRLEKIQTSHDLLNDYLTYISGNPYTSKFHSDLKKDFFELYYGRSYNEDLRYYLRTENAYYTLLKSHLEEVLKIDNSDLYEAYFDSMIPENVGLYIAYHTLEEVKQALTQNNFVLAQEKLFYLNAYFKRSDFFGLKVQQSGFSLSFDELKEEYRRLLEANPTLKDLVHARKFFLNHEVEENKKVIDTLLNMKKLNIWEPFIKEGKTYEEKESGSRIRTPLTKQEEEEVKAYLDQKLYTYLKNNPKALIDCYNRFSNYIAFLFENGVITADRFKGVNRLSEIQSDAVYVFDAFNFETEIKKNKQQLIGRVDRVFHNPGWEEKIEEYANKETSDALKEQGKKLVKKINRF